VNCGDYALGTKSGRSGAGFILVAGLILAACSSSPHDSLANDHRAVDVAQAIVAKDQAIVNSEKAYLAIPCGSDLSTSQSSGTARLYIPTGDAPPVRLVRDREHHELPIPIKEGEPRPVERLLQFQNARQHPGYSPPVAS
jgi:hypothetical protein